MKHWNFRKHRILICWTLLLGIVLQQFVLVIDAENIEASSIAYQYERFISEERYVMASEWLNEHQETIRFTANDNLDKSEPIIEDLVHHNLQIVNDTTIDRQDKLDGAMALVIALDAIENKQQPIWKKTKESLHTNIESVLEEGIIADNKRNEIIAQWEILRPTLAFMLEEDSYKQLVTAYNQLYDGNNETNIEPFQVVFRQANLMDITFPAEQGSFLSFYWIILIVGGSIILTLSYVAWRKYKGQKKKKQGQHNG